MKICWNIYLHLELGYTFIQHTWYVPLGQYSQFCSWKTKDWWCPDWRIWVRFCCVHQNSSKRVTGSGADSSNTYASVTGLCVSGGSSGLGWTQAQACCLWLRRGGHKRSSHTHKHTESLSWNVACVTSSHGQLVKTSPMGKGEVSGADNIHSP